MTDYLDFISTITDRSPTKTFIEKDLATELKYLKNLIKDPKKRLKTFQKAILLNKDKIAELEVFIEENEAEIADG
ncbi:MAG: hypothetical protein KME59_01450 [Trichormus sp. ATA11-4-KO1]|jgi:type I restriction enzyme M protein|nr:hypothetical protein [Trichormus sp. ATA11-4-KO1]